MAQARCLIEVTAAVMPPEVQMTAPCGSTEMHQFHEGCMGVPTKPTGWQRNRPEDKHTRVFGLTSQEWNGGSELGRAALARRIDQANEYAKMLMTSHGFNHVNVTWLWL